MFIIWGSKGRSEKLGVVADVCATCREVCCCWITDIYRVGHIYYISLGQGTRVATVRQCGSCGTEVEVDRRRYEEFASPEAAERMSMDDLLRRTNPGLRRALAQQRQGLPAPRQDEEILDVLPVDEPQ